MKKLGINLDFSPNGGNFSGPGELGLGGGTGDAPGIFSDLISSVIGLMTIIAGIYFLIVFITGGIGWISAGGDKQKLETAQQRLLNGVIGIVVVIAAIFIVDLIGGIIGFDILDIEGAIDAID